LQEVPKGRNENFEEENSKASLNFKFNPTSRPPMVFEARRDINLNVAFHRQVNMLPKLYNCCSFINVMGNMGIHLK